MQLIQASRGNIHALLEQFNVAYKVIPYDTALSQECIEDARQRGYPVDGDHSVRTYLREGIYYVTTACVHLRDRTTKIWIALYTSCAFYVDDVPNRFPEELPNLYLFNDRFIKGEQQGSSILEAFAEIIRRSSDLYWPIASHLITTSTLDFVTAALLEHETRSMKISGSAHQYSSYQRIMSGDSSAYGFMAFPKEIPVKDYIQAIPNIMLFLNNVNDVFSFYKEERVGETTNQISTISGRTNKSKYETFDELTQTTIGVYKSIVETLQGFPEAREVFRHFSAGYCHFHLSSPRYEMQDLYT